jgi:hypothetical protein
MFTESLTPAPELENDQDPMLSKKYAALTDLSACRGVGRCGVSFLRPPAGEGLLTLAERMQLTHTPVPSSPTAGGSLVVAFSGIARITAFSTLTVAGLRLAASQVLN